MKAAVWYAARVDIPSADNGGGMCGRYAFDDSKEIYKTRKLIEEIASKIGSDAASRVKTGEIFPSETAAVVAQKSDGDSVSVMTWGYPLSNAKRLLINARCETVQQKPLFASSLKNQKCLIPCTGFYEWQAQDGHKKKYLIRPDGRKFFYLAGLYQRFEQSERFVILTAPAHQSMRDVHERMPLIVLPEHQSLWLTEMNDTLGQMRKIYAKIKCLEKNPA
jgi:putative SOS response-associated peptidase YedK